MNKTIITGIVALLLSLVTMYFNVPIVPVVLFGIGVVIVGYEVFKMVAKEPEREEVEPLIVIEDLPSLVKKELEVIKIKKVTPSKSTGTKLVKPLVEEQLNPKFVESVKKAPVKKQVSKVIKEDPLAKSKPKRKYNKRKPRVKKEK